MKKIAFASFVLFLAIPAFSQNAINGYWQGVLKYSSSQEFHITFNILKNDNDSLTAKLSVTEQGVKDLPMDKAWMNDSLITIKSQVAHLTYEGVFIPDSMKIKGQWIQGKTKIPLDLTHTDTIKVVKHPQEPVKPYPYKEEEVTFESTGGVKLAGTLTYPSTGENFPAVVMVTGSGPQNRDEEILGHKPFLVIADYLTRNGIAVLRYDDRGANSSTGDYAKATTQDNADDAMAGIIFLKTQKQINPKKIGIIGHSEGGIAAPICAAESKDVAFIVMLAGPGLSGDQILLLQSELIAKTEKINEDTLKTELEIAQKIYNIIKKEKDDKKAAEKLRKLMLESVPDSLKKDLQTSMQISRQIATMTSPWMRFFITFDPQTSLKKTKCPVLALIGEKDLQVPAEQNIPAIEKALTKAKNKDFTVKQMPGLNHLFQHCATGSPTEYANIEETFSPEVLEMMAKWILKR
ncbi:MAG: alpha/beta hydrolase [Bacteroidota bacterium]